MEKRTGNIIILCAIGIPAILMIWFFLEAIGVLGIMIPNPPKPEITYAEFPFALEYEVDGRCYKYEDILICEYKGCVLSTGSGEKERIWEARFKSGNDEITLFKDKEIEIFCFPVGLAEGVAGGMMGDESLAEYVIDSMPEAMYRYTYENGSGKSYGYMYDDSLMKKYKIRLISWECAPPIENTFK